MLPGDGLLLHLNFKVSALELCLLGTCHLLAQLAILRVTDAWFEALMFSAVLCSNTVQLLRSALLRTAGSVVALELNSEGRATLWTRSGSCEGRLVAQPFASRWLTVLILRVGEQRSIAEGPGWRRSTHSRRYLVRVLPDNLGVQERKRLAAHLRYAGCPPG